MRLLLIVCLSGITGIVLAQTTSMPSPDAKEIVSQCHKQQCRLFDLRTGKKSRSFSNGVFLFEDHWIFSNSNNTWGIMDTNFRTKVSRMSGRPLFWIPDVPGGVYNQPELDGSRVIIFDELQDRKKLKDLSVSDYQFKYGLYNLQSRKTLPADYDRILVKRNKSEFLYWCVRYKPGTTEKQGKITILDTAFQEVKTLAFADEFLLDRELRPDSSGYLHRHENNLQEFTSTNKLMVFGNETNSYGAVNPRGEMTVPFLYQYGELRMILIDKCREFYEFSKGQLKYLYDSNGVLCVADYSSLEFLEGHYLVKDTSGWRVLDRDFQCLNEGLEKMQIFPFKGSHGMDKYSFAGVLDGYLYLLQENSFRKLDNVLVPFEISGAQLRIIYNHYRFLSTGQMIYHQYLTDRTGKILGEGRITFFLGQYICLNNSQMYIFNESGHLILASDGIQDVSLNYATENMEVLLQDGRRGVLGGNPIVWTVNPYTRLPVPDGK